MATVLGAAGTGMTGLSAAEAAWPGTNGTIYFACRPTGVGFSGQDICRVNPDGSGLVNLTNTPSQTESIPDVKRDGTQVSFIRGDHVWVMNPDGSGQVEVTTVPSDGTAWTPDGRIAFRAKTSDTPTYEFRTVAATGGATTFLHTATGSDFPPRYTSDGRWLYGTFVETAPSSGTFTQQVIVVNGASETQVTVSSPSLTSNNFPSWSPDGSTIIYQRTVSSAEDLFTVPSGGGTETPLTNTALPVKEKWAQYSPDGTKIVFHQEDAGHDFFHPQLYVADADGTDRELLATPGYDYAGFAVWAPTAGPVPPSTPTASFSADAPDNVKGTKQVKVTLRCLGDASCVVTYGAKLKVPAYGGVGKKTFTIADLKVTLAGHTVKKVKLKLTKAMKDAINAALRAGKKPKYKGEATAKQPNGQLIRTVRFSVTVKDG